MTIRTYDPSKCVITPGPPAKIEGTVTITLHDWAMDTRQALYGVPANKPVPMSIRGTPVAHNVRPRWKRKQAQEDQARLVGIPISQYRRGLLHHYPSVTITPVPEGEGRVWDFTPGTPDRPHGYQGRSRLTHPEPEE